MKHNVGVKWKLFAYFAIYTLIFLLLLWLAQFFFLDDIYAAVKKQEIKAVANDASKYIFSPDDLRVFADEKAKNRNMNFILFSLNEKGDFIELLSVESIKNSTIRTIPHSAIEQMHNDTKSAGGETINIYQFNPRMRGYVPDDIVLPGKSDIKSVVFSKISVLGDEEFFLLIETTLTPLTSTVWILNIILIIVSVVMVIMALILAFLISRKIARPLSVINEKAKSLALGDYSVDFKVNSYREINELGHTLTNTANELSKVDSLKKELIANVSHDLRTPLTMISGYAEIMRDIPGENNPENVDVIINETKRLTSLVNDMLDISKYESGNQTVNKEIFSLTDAIKETVDRYTSFKSQDGFDIKFFANQNITVNTDKSKLLQAFCNLMNNAITYTGEDKLVEVYQTVFVDEIGVYHVKITVIDTGDGIPQDKLDVIWERYYKISSDHRRSVQGSGLGLSIVKNIIGLLGGTCEAQSELGHGCAFSFEIPI